MCLHFFCKRRKKWSALSVWIKADCETSTLKRLNLILSCYVCLIVFLISFCHYPLSTNKEAKLILSRHWHFWWWVSKVLNTGWPHMTFCPVLKIFTNLLIKENSIVFKLHFISWEWIYLGNEMESQYLFHLYRRFSFRSGALFHP